VSYDSNKVKQDTPTNTAFLLTRANSENNYETFSDLFTDSRKGFISKEEFKD